MYGAGDLTVAGGRIPTVTEGQSITFDNLDAGDQKVWHSITACKAPCTGVDRHRVSRSPTPTCSSTPASSAPAGRPPPAATTWTTPTDLPPGTYTYFCRIHPFMRGAFRVLPPAPSAPK